jgi:hypothetical protein
VVSSGDDSYAQANNSWQGVFVFLFVLSFVCCTAVTRYRPLSVGHQGDGGGSRAPGLLEEGWLRCSSLGG